MSKESELTIKERKFLRALFSNGYIIYKAYQEATNGEITRQTAEVNGSRLYAKIRKKDCWQRILEQAGLDDMRLAFEILRLLKMKKVVYFQGEAVGEDDDGFVQLKAAELLAELLGKRKNQIDLHHSGSIEAVVRIYLPENGRENAEPATATKASDQAGKGVICD